MKLEEIYNVYFDLAKYELLDSSKVSLMRIVEFMKKYENTRVEIRAHTDCRGTASFNLSLSDIRARVVATFISNFIRKDRIQYKGFGETRLVNSCSCEGQQIVPCLEQEHKKNRRVEIVVIK
jgi:outer membrane protein OmpA-like peptidoglycan-associated protein